MNALAPFLGVLAGLAGLADTIPYVRDTVSPSSPAWYSSSPSATAKAA